LIKKYLEQKINYLYFEKGRIESLDLKKMQTELAMHSRLSTKDLAASDCYILYKHNSKKLKFKKLNHKKNSTYKTFNLYVNKLLHEIGEKHSLNTSDNLNMDIYILLNELTQELKNTSNLFDILFDEKNEKEYDDIKKIIKISNIKEYISDLKNPQEYKFDILSDKLNKKEFYERYIRNIKNMINNIEYFGVFYPCQFKHDFFANKYYEIDISPIKFKKKKDDLYKLVYNFYDDMALNTNLQENIYSLKNYFSIFRCNLNICYFNPFDNIEKYQNNYTKLEKEFVKNKKDFDEFIEELFMFLDTLQFSTVHNQYSSLLKSMTIKRTKYNNRKKSVREYIKEKLKENNLGENKIFYQILDEQDPKLIYNKNTDLQELNLQNYPNINQQEIFQKYIEILQNLNLDETSTLKYDYSKFILMFDNDFTDFQLSKTSKQVIYKMIYDLITFYKDNEKLSSPFNSTIKKIFDKYEKKSLTELIDEKNITNFITRYDNEFNKYRRMNINCPVYGKISTYIDENNIEYMETAKEQFELCKKEAKLLNLI
jgi:hypothetical protein